MSLSFCYSAEATLAENKAAVARAVLASNLWKELSEVNVVVQVFNNTDIGGDDYEKLEKMIQKRGMTILWPSKDSPPECVCDCALQAALGKTILHHQPSLASYLQDTDIIITADINAFLSKPHIVNVLQSRHSAWMFITEAVFYGAQPWPTSFVALTVQNWKKVTLNASDCTEFVLRDPFIKSKYLCQMSKRFVSGLTISI